MSKLDELEEDLYGKNPDAVTRRRKPATPFARSGTEARHAWNADSDQLSAAPATRSPWKKIILISVAGLVLFAAGGFAFIYLYLGANRREAAVAINGPDSVEAGQLVTIPVVMRNVSATPLQDAALALALPPGTLVRDASGGYAPAEPRIVTPVGALASGEERTQEITVRLFGREGESEEIIATLLYRPEKLSAQFSSETHKQITISRVPLEIFWDVPDTISPRQKTQLTLRFSSQATVPLAGLWLRLDYPPGFAPASADPKPDVADSFWNIGTLDPGKEEKIVITGMFDGTPGELKALSAGLGSFNVLTKEWHPWRESNKELTLSGSPFVLSATIQGKREGVIRPGENVDIAVHYENRSAVGVKNVSVRLAVAGAIADLASVAIGNGGVFDAGSGAIVWGPGGTAQLRDVAPGDTGDLHVSINTRLRPIMRTSQDIDLTLTAHVSVSAPDLPQELQGAKLSEDDTVTLKVATITQFSGRAVFRSSPILNAGPLPPKAGQKTNYTIIWEARDFTNSVENAELAASLPPNIRWENAVFPSYASVSFDTSSGTVHWRIGRLAAGTGVLAPSLTAAFQVSVVPSQSDIGKAITLVSEARFSGKDTFTSEDVTGRVDALTTELHDDPATAPDDWRVVK